MATWVAHLRIAENLLALIDELDPCQFLVGNIAPDSGVPDEKWQTFEPPWEVTHFTGEGRAPWPLGDLEFYREYLNTSNCPTKDKKEYSFLLGYFFHLVTDTLWYYDVGMPTEKRYPQFDKDRSSPGN